MPRLRSRIDHVVVALGFADHLRSMTFGRFSSRPIRERGRKLASGRPVFGSPPFVDGSSREPRAALG